MEFITLDEFNDENLSLKDIDKKFVTTELLNYICEFGDSQTEILRTEMKEFDKHYEVIIITSGTRDYTVYLDKEEYENY